MPPGHADDRLTLSLAETADRLGVTRKHLYNLLNRGEFPVPVVRVGNVWRVSRQALEDFVAGRTSDDNDETGAA